MSQLAFTGLFSTRKATFKVVSEVVDGSRLTGLRSGYDSVRFA